MKMKKDFLSLQKLNKQDSKILIPESAKDSIKKDAEKYLVKDAGPGHWEFGKFIENDAKKGDIILIKTAVSASIDGQVIILGMGRDVVAVF